MNITREEAISLLAQVNKILVNSNSWLENTHEPLNMAFDLAIKALEQEPRWIKCSDHLPDFDVDVLATTKEYGDVVKVTRWRTILKDCGWEWILVDDIESRAYNSDEIIAWMALPKAYREVEE